MANPINIRTRLAAAYHHAAKVVAAALALTALAAVPSTAHADDARMTIVPAARTPPLALPGFGAIVADDATRSVFVSSGGGGDGVEEVGYGGTVLGQLGHEPGADGLALSADGRTLYVALSRADAVAAIDTGTFTEKARFPLPPHRSCPTNLARTGPDVWIGYGCDHGAGTPDSGGVAVLATDTAAPKVALPREISAQQRSAAETHYAAAPLVAASGEAPGTLVVSEPYVNPTTATTYATSAGADPSLNVVRTTSLGGSELADLAASPDGATAFAALGSQTTVDALSTASLAVAGQYATGLGPDAVAVSPDGTELAATAAIPGSHVYVWRLGDPAGAASGSGPAGDYGRPESGAPAPRGLAFSGDGRLLFFVTEPPSGQGGPTLTVLEVDQD
ncbi:YncE family protein [Actinospica robiniae]|uniref:YncE family protein n=1 Tax=Actinospica robiniae TaxID=304901 RepID=UPI00041E05A5|nr:hypothetical protein [Actinospica robiniae]